MPVSSNLSVRRFAAPLGAEIMGVDASHDIDIGTVAAIKDALDQNLVIVLRDQKLSGNDLVRFGACLGEITESATSPYKLKENPLVSVLSNILDENGRNIGRVDSGEFWHTDGAYFAEPTAYTVLYALEVPYGNGTPLGDTQFVSTADAYDVLPENMKRRLEGLKAVHKLTRRYEYTAKRKFTEDQQKKNPDRVHPVIRTHPNTGRKCIYVSVNYTDSIVGMPFKEGRALVDELCAHCIDPRFRRYTHKWQVGDLLVWDNCATLHKATFDYALPQRRLLYRMTVKGGPFF